MSEHRPEFENLNARGLRIGVVASRFNAQIVDRLLSGALDALRAMQAHPKDLCIVRVAGALEIPTIAAAMADLGYQAIVCLGCVIRGETDHYEHVCRVAMDGVGKVALRGDVGVGNGILTVSSLEQAFARAGGEMGNKGEEAARVAVETARTIQWLRAKAR